MPPKTPRLKFARHSVTAVLVSHDGARWLPTSLAALAAQTRPPQRVVAVDTSSRDDSAHLLAESLGGSAVVTAAREVGLGPAVQRGLDAFAAAPEPPPPAAGQAQEWVWILHDDCAPAPSALDRLLARAEESPSASVIGPKVTSWDGRRLTEVGVTIDSAGHRETGLEPRELDQGQHDDVTDVLAVGTAGMLVRRDMWDRLGGLDDTWALFGEDIDFGWRVNAAGGRVIVAANAVVRHAAALAQEMRAPDAVSGRPTVLRRRNGMQVLLANTATWLLPLYVARFVVESVLRAVTTLVLLRRPARAWDELAAVAGVLRAPLVVARARRRRRPDRERPHGDIRHLLAPPGLRIRRFGDAVAAAFAGRAAVEGRSRRRAPIETGPVSEEAESFEFDDMGVLRQLLRRPSTLLLLAATAAALVADRAVLSSTLHGGRLLPAPAGAADLWSTYTASWHGVGVGSTTTAPPWIAGFGSLSWLLLGKPWLAVAVVVLGAMPLAALSFYLCSRIVTDNPGVRLWSSVLYALLPAATASVTGGRLDIVVVEILVPVAARACVAALQVDPARSGWHRAVAAGLLLAFVAAFSPLVWITAVVPLIVGAFLACGRGDLQPGQVRRHLSAAAVVLAVAPVLLLPWTLRVVSHPALLVSGAGLPETQHSRHPVSTLHLLALHAGGPGMPVWWSWTPLVVVAVVGLAFATRRRAATAAYSLLLSGLGAAVVVSKLSAKGPAGADTRYWTGAALVVAGLGAVAGFAMVVDRLPAALRNHAFGWRQPAAALLVIAAAGTSVISAGSWLSRGVGKPLSGSSTAPLPVFATAEASAPTSPRVLILRSSGDVVRYVLLRHPSGLSLGDADVDYGTVSGTGPTGATRRARDALAAAVRDLAAGRDSGGAELAELGVSLVVVPADPSGVLTKLTDISTLARVPASDSVVYRSTIATGELVVLPAADAASARNGRTLRSTATPAPLIAGAGSARVQLSPGVSDRLLVLTEPVDNAWHATLDGHPLAHTTAYGWAQAWILPASGGALVVSRADGSRSLWLVLELVLVIGACLLALPTRRFGRRVVDEEPS